MRMKIILMIIHGIKRMLMTGKQRMPTSHSKSTTKDLKTSIKNQRNSPQRNSSRLNKNL